MKKRIISASLAAAMLLTAAAAAGPVTAAADANDYGLPERTADGVILHCFDWSFNAIRENLPEIAAAGYTTVQTSPVQQPKDYGPWLNGEGQWWKLYQPISFTVATEDSWIGTKDELTALCEEADKYGIKIICDVVSNHMANETGNVYLTYSHSIKKYEPDLYKGKETYFHQLKRNVEDSRLEWLVQGELDYLPDLNTGDEFVQSRVISLLKECIDCGVDGFRFDAAKHIETPADGDYASDFWPNVVGAANDYAAEKGSELFIYGEVLNSPGKDRSTLDYTKYINLVDNKAGDITLYNVVKKKPERLLIGQQYTYQYDDPSNFVIWAESHDTYMGNSGSGGFGNTASISNEDIAKAWAIVAARAKSHALYFARPNEIMGLAGDTAWKSTVVTEVNKFHNKFVGTDDQIYADNDVVAVQRGDSGIVLVNLSDTSAVIVQTQSMKAGDYVDAITGTVFTVNASGQISGTIGESGVAVIYADAKTAPKVKFSAEDTTFRRDTYSVKLTLENAYVGTYAINNGAPTQFTGEEIVTIGEGADAGSTFTITATATDNDGRQVTESHTYTKEAFEHSGVYVYFDNSETNYKNVFAYGYYEYIDDNGRKVPVTQDGQWPGTKMEYDAEKGLYVYEVPADIPVGLGSVIINNANGWETAGLTIPAKESIYDAKQKKLVDPNGVTLMYGDVDGDNSIASGDALAILRYTNDAQQFDDAQQAQADVDGDKSISSADALLVLRYSVNLSDTNNLTGTTFTFGGSSGGNTPAPTPSGTVFYAINSAGWIFNDGCKLWLMNNATGETIEMTKSDESSDSSKYAYVDLPQGWSDISLHRTQWNMTVEESKDDPAYGVWQCGEIPADKNAYSITDNGKGKFRSYTPA